MSVDQAKAVGRRRWELANEHSLDGYDEVLAEDFIHHGPGYAFHGRQSYKDHLADFYHGYPEAHVAIEETTGNEAWVATICTLTARQENPTPWSPNPTGEPQIARLVTIHAIADGKIVEEWIVQEWGADRSPGS